MAQETFQQLSSEIISKAKDGTLTIGEAIDFTLDSRVPLPEDYNTKNKKGEQFTGNKNSEIFVDGEFAKNYSDNDKGLDIVSMKFSQLKNPLFHHL